MLEANKFMDNDQKILDEVKKTISLLDQIKNIETSPYLYTRIKAHIDSKNYDSKSTNVNPVFKFAKQLVFALLILFNIYTIINFLSTDEQTSATREQYIKNVKSEYFLDYNVDYLANLNMEE